MLAHVNTTLSCKTVAFKMSFCYIQEWVKNQREKIKTQSKWIEYRFRTHNENSISANDKCEGNFEKWNEIKHMSQTCIQGYCRKKHAFIENLNMHYGRFSSFDLRPLEALFRTRVLVSTNFYFVIYYQRFNCKWNSLMLTCCAHFVYIINYLPNVSIKIYILSI